AAVAVLGKTGDPKWIKFLETLREGGVYARKVGGKMEIVVAGAKTTRGDQELVEIKSAYDVIALGTVPLTELTEVSADRRLRIAIKPFLDAGETQSQLADRDPEVRRGAAIKLGYQASASSIPQIEQALAKENDRWVRHALAEALGLIRLATGDPAG